jgi:nucleoside-diphosphate-sugar epimerase
LGLNKVNIGISCIGSGVGQSVINSLRLSKLPFYTVGLGTNQMAFGAYECDTFDYTPNIYAEGYIDYLIAKCKEHKIDLLIPGNDDEVLLYAQNSEKFSTNGIKAIFPDEALVALCRDKKRMSEELGLIADVFVKSFDPDEVENALNTQRLKFPFIAKPRGGYASKGIEIINSQSDLQKITPAHIVQELAIPSKGDPNHEFYMKQLARNINPQVSEISIQLVYSPEGNLMGRMCSFNKLNNGIPIEILPYDEPHLWEVVDKLTPTLLRLGLKGPLNIQGRLTDAGLKIFEMNPRFTGITGLRALMGFNEVVACAKEWLGIDKGANKLALNHNRFGIRQTADKSIAIEHNAEVAQLSLILNKRTLKSQKTILLTGATGYLGRQLTKRILEANDQFELITLGRDTEKSKEILGDSNTQHFSYDDLRNGKFFIGNADILLHAGFARPHCTHKEIAQSLALTNELFTMAAMSQVPVIINISSLSVYGLKQAPPWDEATPAAPETAYAQAKYAAEQCLLSLSRLYPHIKQTSLRLATLAGGHSGLVEVDFMSKMIKQALHQEDIRLIHGNQQMERLHVIDAADAIMQVLVTDFQKPAPVYNLGAGTTYTLKHIADEISETVARLAKTEKVNIIVEPGNEVPPSFGINSELFFEHFNWKPKQTISSIVESLADHIITR